MRSFPIPERKRHSQRGYCDSVGGIGKRGSRKRIGDAVRVGRGRCWRRYSWEFLVFSSVPTVGHGVVLAVVGLGFCPSLLATKRDEELQGE